MADNRQTTAAARPLTYLDQGFVLLAAAMCLWHHDPLYRKELRGRLRPLLPLMDVSDPYLEAIVTRVARVLDPAEAKAAKSELFNELQEKCSAFLEWRGLAALAQAEKVGQMAEAKARAKAGAA